MTLEDLCLASGICFVLLYAVTLVANCLIVIDHRNRELALHRIRCPNRRP
jgi:cell division protein FtsL